MTATFAPQETPLAELGATLRSRGFAILNASDVALLAHVAPADLHALTHFWDDLPEDTHLRDGGRYRRRRHGSFVVDPGIDVVRPVPHRPHYQPVEYNALHGGIERWFAPLDPGMAESPAWLALLRALGHVAAELRGKQLFYGEAHPFRIQTEGGIGRPTPEGAHRDGVDLVCVLLIGRSGIKGGETRVFDADGPSGSRFTLSEPWSALLLDDARVIHETTPIQSVQNATTLGHRDTLVITFRAGNFQGKSTVG